MTLYIHLISHTVVLPSATASFIIVSHLISIYLFPVCFLHTYQLPLTSPLAFAVTLRRRSAKSRSSYISYY
ncbi:hypothetical protein B0H11DRAFT_927849 [Mycena galericulata]|nr:hypothetical protein B0H11DRAFT_927849 [Mycena galericulata]